MQPVYAQFANADRVPTRAPVKKVLARYRIVESHGVDVLDAFAAHQRTTRVVEWAGGLPRGRHADALSGAVVRLRGVIKVELPPELVIENMRCPELLLARCPGRL